MYTRLHKLEPAHETKPTSYHTEFSILFILIHHNNSQTFCIICFCFQKAAVAAFAWSGGDAAAGLNSLQNNNNSNNNNNNHNNNNNNTNSIQAPSTAAPVSGHSPSVSTSTACSTAALAATMPVGGVQSQNPTQGLVHWMSAVMAEHMTSNSHHDPTVGMHYMWNGGVDVSIKCHTV